jgi:hypothetical protein
MREVDREFRAATKIKQREADERMSLAWHIVALDRTEKLPPLRDLLSKDERRGGKQTQDEILAGMVLAFGEIPEDLKGSNDKPG